MPDIRVLLVEDDETEAAQTRSMLCESDATPFEVEWVATRTTRSRACRRTRYDVYLVDVTLGEAPAAST